MTYVLFYLIISALLYYVIGTRENIHPFLNGSADEFQKLLKRSLFFPYYGMVWLMDRHIVFQVMTQANEWWESGTEWLFNHLYRLKR